MKPIVLTLTNSYLPGFRGGGPARTIVALVQRLTEFEFRVVTPDRDKGATEPYTGIVPSAWQSVAGGTVFYASATGSLATLRDVIAVVRRDRFDLLYLNSFFHPTFTLAPLAARRLGFARRTPVLLAPRGELSSGALGLKSLRKRAFMSLALATGLYSDVDWHVSTEHEAAEVRRLFPSARIHVAIDLSPIVKLGTSNRAPKRQGTARLAFISRIVPKKNLDYAIRILASVRAHVELDIFGPLEDPEHYRAVEAEIAKLPPNITVRHCGELQPEDVCATFARYDAFLFPTRAENFGHVIIESMWAGCPVILSDQTPWHGLEALGVGFDLPLAEPSAFTRAVETIAADDESGRQRRATAATSFARSFLSREEHLASNRAMFGALARPS